MEARKTGGEEQIIMGDMKSRAREREIQKKKIALAKNFPAWKRSQTRLRLDHTSILGDTLEKIALDKAGIFKPGVPALVGKSCPVELLKVGAAAESLQALCLQ